VVNCELQMTYYCSEYGHVVAGKPYKEDMNMAHESPSNEKTYSPGNSQLRNLELMINTILHSITPSPTHSSCTPPSFTHSLTPSLSPLSSYVLVQTTTCKFQTLVDTITSAISEQSYVVLVGLSKFGSRIL